MLSARGPGGRIGLVMLTIIIACQLATIWITVRLVQWSADFYNALQKLDAATAVSQIGVFSLLTLSSASLYLGGHFVRRHLHMRWRRRLTHMMLDSWTRNKTLWFLHPAGGGREKIDNPDQRIAEDCDIFVGSMLGTGEGSCAGLLDFFMSLIGLVSFVTLLWSLATFSLSFSLLGWDVEIPRYMVWAAPFYVVISTLITHALGRPLPRLLAEQQKREADFRSGLMHVRENASSISLSGGEAAERRMLDARFEGIATIWNLVVKRQLIYGLFMRPYFQTVLRIPTFLALPAFFAGKVTFGGLMQLASAFSNVVTTISWFIFNYKFLADLAATTRRLQRFADAMAGEPAVSPPAVSRHDELVVSDLLVSAPDGRILFELGSLRVTKGEAVWLHGPSGLGKSTLVKVFAGLWPVYAGSVSLPNGRLYFTPQQVYMPLGSLLDAAVYPLDSREVSVERVALLLRAVGLGARLNAGVDHQGMSVGEQQRLAIVRMILARPDWAFLDEATSALDVQTERCLMEVMRRELPDTSFIMIAHREPLGFAGLREVDLVQRSAGPVAFPDWAAGAMGMARR